MAPEKTVWFEKDHRQNWNQAISLFFSWKDSGVPWLALFLPGHRHKEINPVAESRSLITTESAIWCLPCQVAQTSLLRWNLKPFPEEHCRPLSLDLTFDRVATIPLMYQFEKCRRTTNIDICLCFCLWSWTGYIWRLSHSANWKKKPNIGFPTFLFTSDMGTWLRVYQWEAPEFRIGSSEEKKLRLPFAF